MGRRDETSFRKDVVTWTVLLLLVTAGAGWAAGGCENAPDEATMARMSQDELIYAYCDYFNQGDKATMEALKLSMAGDNDRAGREIRKRRICTATANDILDFLKESHDLTRYQFTCTKWFPSLP